MRAVVRRASGALALLNGIWSLWLIAFGGVSVTIFGLLVRSHDPFNPLLLCAVSIALFLLTGGATTLRACQHAVGVRALMVWNRLLPMWRAGYVPNAIVGVLVVSILILGFVYKSTAAGGADSFGYLSQAELWREGRLSVHQPWLNQVPWPNSVWSFAPLGYRPATQTTAFTFAGYRPEFDRWSIVPVYSPGLPLLMAVGRTVGGMCGPFLVVPVCGALFVLSTYLIGVRLGSRTLGLLATLLVATSPPFLLMNFENMSDVPVAAAIAIASWCVLGTTITSAIGAAAALAMALLIRPNLVPLAPIFVAWLAWRVVRERSERPRHLWRAAIVAGGIGAAVVTTAAIYWLTYGTPFQSGYGPTAAYFSSSNIGPNLRNYMQWFGEAHTALGFLGLLALAIPIKAVWPDVRDRSAVIAFAVITAAVIVEFLFYLVLDNSSYLRFFLVCYPFIMLGLASIALALSRVHRVAGPLLAIALIGGMVANGLRVSTMWSVLHTNLLEAKYADVAAHVRGATRENSVVLAMQHSGSLRYYAGRVTLRWDFLPGDWLDRAVDWMAVHGVHTYALLDDFEQREAVKRFRGQKLVAILEGPPVFRFGNKMFYDLGLPPGSPIETVNLPVVDIWPKCWTPFPPPALVWNIK